MAILILIVVLSLILIPLSNFLGKGIDAAGNKFGNKRLKEHLNSDKVKAERLKENQNDKNAFNLFLLIFVIIVVIIAISYLTNN